MTKLELCNLVLSKNIETPYYYIYNNETSVVYFKHKKASGLSNNRSIILNVQKTWNPMLFTKQLLVCGENANYEAGTIEIADNVSNDLIIPINEKENIILRSMDDTDYRKAADTDRCEIFAEGMKKAKPIQFPYSTFYQVTELDNIPAISIMFAHFYYKHGNTNGTVNENSISSIVNEACDIIDSILLPECTDTEGFENEKFILHECDSKTQQMSVEYINCNTAKFNVTRAVSCSSIPHLNYKGIIILSITSLSILIETFLAIFIIIYRRDQCVHVSGYKFLIFLIGSTIILNSSVFVWVGEPGKVKCIAKIWLIALGMTCFISSYSIKSQTIISIYNNKKMLKNVTGFKYYLFYLVLIICQIILLFIWSFTNKGVEKKLTYVRELGYYYKDLCSTGNEYLLLFVFSFDFSLLSLSIIVSYRGRNIPAQFNYSKKIFLTAIISTFLLLACYLMVTYNFDSTQPSFFILLVITIISLIICIIFVGPKIATILNLDTDDGNRLSVLVVDSSKRTCTMTSDVDGGGNNSSENGYIARKYNQPLRNNSLLSPKADDLGHHRNSLDNTGSYQGKPKGSYLTSEDKISSLDEAIDRRLSTDQHNKNIANNNQNKNSNLSIDPTLNPKNNQQKEKSNDSMPTTNNNPNI